MSLAACSRVAELAACCGGTPGIQLGYTSNDIHCWCSQCQGHDPWDSHLLPAAGCLQGTRPPSRPACGRSHPPALRGRRVPGARQRRDGGGHAPAPAHGSRVGGPGVRGWVRGERCILPATTLADTGLHCGKASACQLTCTQVERAGMLDASIPVRATICYLGYKALSPMRGGATVITTHPLPPPPPPPLPQAPGGGGAPPSRSSPTRRRPRPP